MKKAGRLKLQGKQAYIEREKKIPGQRERANKIGQKRLDDLEEEIRLERERERDLTVSAKEGHANGERERQKQPMTSRGKFAPPRPQPESPSTSQRRQFMMKKLHCE